MNFTGKKSLKLNPGLWVLFVPQLLKQDKGQALTKSTCHVHISTVKFASLFKESPCSPVVAFPSFGSEGHGVQPPQGRLFFSYFFSTSLMIFRTNFLFYLFNQLMLLLKKLFKKRHQTCLIVKYIYLVLSCLFILCFLA